MYVVHEYESPMHSGEGLPCARATECALLRVPPVPRIGAGRVRARVFSFRSYGAAGARHTRGTVRCTANYMPRALYVFQQLVLSTPTGTLVFDYILFAVIRPN